MIGQVEVLVHHQLGLAELDLARDLGELAAVLVDDHDAHLVRALGLEPVELEHDREVHPQRRRELLAVAAGDPTRGHEQEAFAHLREVGEHRSGDVHQRASVGGATRRPGSRTRGTHDSGADVRNDRTSAASGWHTRRRARGAEHRIETEAELRELIGQPADIVCAKVTDRLNPLTRQYIERSPFLCIATSDAARQLRPEPARRPGGVRPDPRRPHAAAARSGRATASPTRCATSWPTRTSGCCSSSPA